jgi:hypothetical protein
MPRANPQQNKKYYSCDPRQTHGDFHNKIGQHQTTPSDKSIYKSPGTLAGLCFASDHDQVQAVAPR